MGHRSRDTYKCLHFVFRGAEKVDSCMLCSALLTLTLSLPHPHLPSLSLPFISIGITHLE